LCPRQVPPRSEQGLLGPGHFATLLRDVDAVPVRPPGWTRSQSDRVSPALPPVLHPPDNTTIVPIRLRVHRLLTELAIDVRCHVGTLLSSDLSYNNDAVAPSFLQNPISPGLQEEGALSDPQLSSDQIQNRLLGDHLLLRHQ